MRAATSGQRPSWVATVTPRRRGRPLQLAQHVGALVDADEATPPGARAPGRPARPHSRRRARIRRAGAPRARTASTQCSTGSSPVHREVVRHARPRRLGGLGEDLVGDRPAGQLLGPPRRRVADRVHRAIMPGDGDALRHGLGVDRRRASRRTPPIVHGDVRRTWREYDERAARLAARVRRRPASGPTARSGCTSTTATSTSRRSSAAFKMRGVPINVNYRYLDDELCTCSTTPTPRRSCSTPRSATGSPRVVDRLPKLQAADRGRRRRRRGTGRRRACRTRTCSPRNDPMERIARREDDIYMLYTGGTTGMPKGVMYAMACARRRCFLRAGFPLLGLTASARRVARSRRSSRGHGRRRRRGDRDPLLRR